MESIYQWDRGDKLFAIEALHHLDDPGRGDYLLQLIVDDDPVVRGKTALAMEGLDDELLLEAVDALMDQGETEYDILACELLGSTVNTDFSGELKRLLKSGDDRVVRAAIEVLDNLPVDATLDLFEDVVENYRAEWSKSLKRLLNRWHPSESFPLIKSLFDKTDDELKPHLLRLAAVTDHPGAVSWVQKRLPELTLSDQKSNVVQWLSER